MGFTKTFHIGNKLIDIDKLKNYIKKYRQLRTQAERQGINYGILDFYSWFKRNHA